MDTIFSDIFVLAGLGCIPLVLVGLIALYIRAAKVVASSDTSSTNQSRSDRSHRGTDDASSNDGSGMWASTPEENRPYDWNGPGGSGFGTGAGDNSRPLSGDGSQKGYWDD